MANINETATYSPNIYQLDLNDPVLGGTPEFDMAGNPTTGYSNAPIKQLADRTAYLKTQVDTAFDDITTLEQDFANSTDPAKGAGLVGRAVVAVESMVDLISLPPEARRGDVAYVLKSYRGSGGGGIFAWDSTVQKTSHNGGTVIDPERPWPANWASRTNVSGWFSAGTTGVGCFVKIQPQEGRVSAAEFGVVAGSPDGQSISYQAAINYVGSTGGGVVTSGFNNIRLDADPTTGVCLDVFAGVFIDNRGCELELIPTASDGYSIVNFSDSALAPAGIFGGVIRGDKYTHLGTTGEWGMGINIRGASAVYVDDISCVECWGDGIYVGAGLDGAANPAGTVILDNVRCDDNRRQGLSIVAAEKVLIPYGEFTNTSGTAPEAGVDIEPNLNDTITSVKFGTIVCSGNSGAGFMVVAPFLPSLVGSVTGREIIAEGNSKEGVSVETTDLFSCQRVFTKGNARSGLNVASVKQSYVGEVIARDNGHTSSIRSAAVNYRNTAGNHYVGRLHITGGTPLNGALITLGNFECSSFDVDGVVHPSGGAVTLTPYVQEGVPQSRVKLGSVGLRNLPRSGLVINSGLKANIGDVVLEGLGTTAGTFVGVYNESTYLQISNIFAYAGGGLTNVFRNLGNNSVVNSVLAAPAASSGPAINDMSTGSVVQTTITT